jgi:hypothetical protein
VLKCQGEAGSLSAGTDLLRPDGSAAEGAVLGWA